VTFSISSMRATSAAENWKPSNVRRSAARSSAGTSPSFTMASAASSSTSSQMRKRRSGDQMQAISGRV